MQLAFWYFVGMAWRLYALRALLVGPKFHGDEYFFDTHVGPGFYAGPGRRVLRLYRMQILTPYIMELGLIAFIALRFPGNFLYLVYLLAAAASVDGIRYVYITRLYSREGWRYASPQVPAPSGAMAIGLQIRQPQDYEIPEIERIVFGATAIGTILFLYVIQHAGFHLHWRDILLKPAGCLYGLLGAALVQRWLITSRLVRIPGNRPQDFIAWREEVRLYFLRVFDALRLFLAGTFFVLAVLGASRQQMSGEWRHRTLQVSLMALAAVAGAMLLRSLSRLVAASKKVGAASPMMREPALPLTHPFAGLFCWEPDLRAVAIRTGPAYRINLAEARTYLYAAYLAGFTLFGVWSRLG